jgi:hypothetical protein
LLAIDRVSLVVSENATAARIPNGRIPCDEIDQSLNLYGNHVWIFGPLPFLPFLGVNRAARSAIHPGADFHDRLGRHFERKIARVSMASTLGAMAIAPIWAAAMRPPYSIMQICAVHPAFSNQRNWIADRTPMPCTAQVWSSNSV